MPNKAITKANPFKRFKLSAKITQASIAAIGGSSKRKREANPDETLLRLYNTAPIPIPVQTIPRKLTASHPDKEIGKTLSSTIRTTGRSNKLLRKLHHRSIVVVENFTLSRSASRNVAA